MDVIKDILHDKWPDLKGQVQPQRVKLTGEDMARLSDKREELIVVLRQWHGYSRMQADRVISSWLYNHGQGRPYRAPGSFHPHLTPSRSRGLTLDIFGELRETSET